MPPPPADPTAAWTALITRYYDGCSSGGLIREIRSYYQMRPESTQLDGFPYAGRGYSVAGHEYSPIHPEATR